MRSRLSQYKALALAWLCLLGSTAAQAQAQDSAAIAQGLDKLGVLGSVLYIAAHPDDENTQLLAWLAQQKHYRTAYLSLTRGDGGQNLLGEEQGIALGLIRTQELLAARREDGAEQYFSRARDFGFSKRADETLDIWQQERILGDIVWLIRKLQPDVIITRFPEDARAGHGQHQASAILARLAFHAAADPKRFPEQLKQVAPWQAKRLVWNTWESFLGSGSTRSPEQLRIDVGGFNPRLGKSYGEIAALSRNHHQSQGFGSRALRGHVWETFAAQAGLPLQQELLQDIDTSWARINSKEAQVISKQIAQLQQSFKPSHPSDSLPGLLALHKSISALPTGYWREQKLRETEALIVAAAGIWLDSLADKPNFALGEVIPVKTSIVVRGPVPVELIAIDQTPQQLSLKQDEQVQIGSQVSSKTRPSQISQPYWLQSQPDEGAFQLARQEQLEQAWAADIPAQQITLSVSGQRLTLIQAVNYQHLDPLRGEVSRPVQVTPPLSIQLENPAYLLPLGSTQRIKLSLQGLVEQSGAEPISGELKITAPLGWQVRPLRQAFKLSSGQASSVTLEVQAPETANEGTLGFSAEVNGQSFALSQQHINYPHIPELDWFAPAQAKLVSLELKTGGRKLGYLPGAGDKVAPALRQLGYEVTELDSKTLAQQNLGRFDAIITGVRAYNVDKQLAAAHAQLMDYVSQGGVLLAQYNTLGIHPGNTPEQLIGPYPFQISRARVSEENAAVRVLLPEHPLLNRPNRISNADFAGWVQERGLYFVSQADPHYEHLLGMHDQGEAELDGSLITTKYGQGRFTYAPLAFFRQLPAGVPGAARLLANLLAGDKSSKD